MNTHPSSPRNPHNRHAAQSGFAAIAAIFLVVALAALGGFMLTFSNTQQLTSAQDVQGTRAYWAARAGLEWAIVNSATATAAAAADCTTTATPPATIEDFNMVITCARVGHVDGDNINIFQITATASVGTSPGVGVGFTERSVSASVCRLQASPYSVC